MSFAQEGARTGVDSPPAGGGSSIRLIWRFGAFALATVAVHVAAMIAAFPVLFLRLGRGLAEFAVALFALIGLLLASRLFLRRVHRLPLGAIGAGLDRPWAQHMVGGLLGGAALISIAWAAFILAGWAVPQWDGLGSLHYGRLAFAMLFCLVTAAQEEVVCRGYAFQLVYRRFPAAALVIGGLVFLSLHLLNSGGLDPLALANLFIAHLLFSAAYLRTRSLWLPIGLHAGWNFAEGFLLGMPISGRTSRFAVITTDLQSNLWTGHSFGPEGGLVVTLVLASSAIVAWLLLKQRRPTLDFLAESPAPAGPAAGFQRETDDLPALGRPADRMLAPDVLRGIALLGILPMNMQIFAMVPGAVVYPYAGDHTDPANIAAWTLLRVFIGSKDLSIFSMLFGAGLLMAASSRDGDRGSTALHYRRMAVLFIFGLAHAYLIWAGDILVTYAICGSLVYLVRGLRPRWMITIGAAAYAVPMGLLLAAHFLLPHMPENFVAGIASILKPSGDEIAAFNQTYGGDWTTQMSLRASDAIANQTINVVLCMGWIACGMMLIGMGFHRQGVLTAKKPDRFYWGMIVTALVVGFPVLIYSFMWSFARDWRIPEGFFLGWFFRESAYPIIVLGWIGAVMLVCKHGLLPRATAGLAAVGRLALTNYLLQSIICSLIFYGHGLGLVGRVDHIRQIGITLAIWAFQLAASAWWVRHFRFGPAEWLWRSLVYGSWQPMRSARREPWIVPA